MALLLQAVRQTCPNLAVRRAEVRHSALDLSRLWVGTAKSFDGTGHLTGVVRLKGKPAERRILVIDAKTNLVIRNTWSAKDGSYRIDRLDATRHYHVMAIDYIKHSGKKYEPWVASFIKPCTD